MWISLIPIDYFLRSINGLVFAIEMSRVYSAVRAESLRVIQVNFRLQRVKALLTPTQMYDFEVRHPRCVGSITKESLYIIQAV